MKITELLDKIVAKYPDYHWKVEVGLHSVNGYEYYAYKYDLDNNVVACYIGKNKIKRLLYGN